MTSRTRWIEGLSPRRCAPAPNRARRASLSRRSCSAWRTARMWGATMAAMPRAYWRSSSAQVRLGRDRRTKPPRISSAWTMGMAMSVWSRCAAVGVGPRLDEALAVFKGPPNGMWASDRAGPRLPAAPRRGPGPPRSARRSRWIASNRSRRVRSRRAASSARLSTDPNSRLRWNRSCNRARCGRNRKRNRNRSPGLPQIGRQPRGDRYRGALRADLSRRLRGGALHDAKDRCTRTETSPGFRAPVPAGVPFTRVAFRDPRSSKRTAPFSIQIRVWWREPGIVDANIAPFATSNDQRRFTNSQLKPLPRVFSRTMNTVRLLVKHAAPAYRYSGPRRGMQQSDRRPRSTAPRWTGQAP